MAVVIPILLRCWQQFASAVLASASGSGGSGWQASSSNSFEVVADYWDSDDLDGYGIARYSVPLSSALHGLVLVAADTVTLTWAPAARRPKRYLILYQAAATFNPANASTIIGEVDGDTSSITITAPVSQGTVAAHDQATTVTLDPAWLSPAHHQLSDVAAGGELVKLSRVHTPYLMPDGNDSQISPYSGLTLDTAKMGGDLAMWNTLLKWQENQAPLVLIDQNSGIDLRYKYYHGCLGGIPYIGSNGHYLAAGGRNSAALRVQGVGLA